MEKIQSQGVHHITICGADRQTSIDFWEGLLGMPFVFEQPNLDNEGESHLYFDPGDGRLITIFTDESRTPDPTPHADGPGLRPPRRIRDLQGDLRSQSPSGSTSAGSRTAASRTEASWTRSTSTTRSASRSSSPPTGSSRRRASRTPRCCSRRTSFASHAATTTSPRSIWPTRSRISCSRSRASLSEDRSPKNPY